MDDCYEATNEFFSKNILTHISLEYPRGETVLEFRRLDMAATKGGRG